MFRLSSGPSLSRQRMPKPIGSLLEAALRVHESAARLVFLKEIAGPRHATRGGKDVVAALKSSKRRPASTRPGLSASTPGVDILALRHGREHAERARRQDRGPPRLLLLLSLPMTRWEFSTPTLVLIGDKDDWTPAKLCEAVKGKPDLEMVVFSWRDPRLQRCLSEKPMDYLGHHFRA